MNVENKKITRVIEAIEKESFLRAMRNEVSYTTMALHTMSCMLDRVYLEDIDDELKEFMVNNIAALFDCVDNISK